jgi:hypothetical protein
LSLTVPEKVTVVTPSPTKPRSGLVIVMSGAVWSTTMALVAVRAGAASAWALSV